ncbi:MAG: multicomponent Na+H+ antiporter subunit [Prolixibacteraceae bacterium]|nr:MAG: multicomponent Na+H+ antiporter subunit [Prolixibacteraceae bacterium]
MNKIIISVFILLGSFFILVAAIGILRFKDLYGRLHATTKATSFGLLLMLVGVSLFFNIFPVYMKSLLIIIFIFLTAPLAAHSIAKSFTGNGENSDNTAENN